MIQIAHRGLWWPEVGHQLSTEAAERAAYFGYAVELDVCLEDDDVLVKHHPHVRSSYNVVGHLARCSDSFPLYFWDIKTDGLVKPLIAKLRGWGVTHRSVIFDHDLQNPETGFFNTDLAAGEQWKEEAPELLVCTRASQRYHLDFAFRNTWAGAVWMDGIDGDWVEAADIERVHDAGKKAFVVSPEVHGRPLKLAIWKGWQAADGILTDVPHFADALNRERDKLYPKEPWW